MPGPSRGWWRSRRPWVLAVLLVVLGIGWGAFRSPSPRLTPASWRAQPDSYPFGAVVQGGRIEFGIRVFVGQPLPMAPAWMGHLPWPVGRLASLCHTRYHAGRVLGGWRRQVDVRVPACVRLTSARIGWLQVREGAYMDFEGDVVADQPGDWNEPLALVSRGEDGVTNRLEIPIRLRVTAPESNAPVHRVLVCSSPYDVVSTEKGSDFGLVARVFEQLAERRVRVDVLRAPPRQLEAYDLVLLAEEELADLQPGLEVPYRTFVEGGGHLVLAGDAFFAGTAVNANRLSEPVGLRFETHEEREGLVRFGVVPDPITEGLRAPEFRGYVLVHGNSGKEVRELLVEPGVPGGVVAVSRASGRGEVRALGRSLWWLERGTNTEDSVRLLVNLLTPPARQKP